MNAEELKPCPFCGTKNVALLRGGVHGWWRVGCNDCDGLGAISVPESKGDGPDLAVKHRAVATWNNRPGILAAQREAEERMRERCAKEATRWIEHALKVSHSRRNFGQMLACTDEEIRALPSEYPQGDAG